MADYITVFTTTDDREAAEELARSAVEARLAACAQIDGPISSVYWWDGAVQNEQEWRITYKTPASKYADLAAHIKAGHTYEVPEIIATPITDGSPDYLSWLDDETAPR
ncbi:divalent-cation tolerance protein CutA [Streptomyces sp. RFCAC02]|uniref:divalent-cation tolerance protein CutA n=1 Tax=Streptomyces sp. RFCAC02 TaxID=2499143 RepID=UPI00102154F6|nr:divalent-cation tolerance protein CutA [Streptomyces sp. RFCAC02]